MKIDSIYNLALVFILTISFSSCKMSKNVVENQKNSIELMEVSFEKIGMSGSENLVINSKEKMRTESNRSGLGEGVKSDINPKDWNELVAIVQNLNIEEFQNMKAPSQERFHDGARATTIIIKTADSEIRSQTYDEGKPPASVKILNDYLESL